MVATIDRCDPSRLLVDGRGASTGGRGGGHGGVDDFPSRYHRNGGAPGKCPQTITAKQ